MRGYEIEAAKLAGKMGGEYLESIGKFDLEKLSGEEWKTFIQCICKEYGVKRAELFDDEIPF